MYNREHDDLAALGVLIPVPGTINRIATCTPTRSTASTARAPDGQMARPLTFHVVSH